MPRLSLPSAVLNPHVDRVTLSDGYELCSRCGQPILNGESAFVMWRDVARYGSFAHTFKCASRNPRNWTKILKYEQANEVLFWNSQRVPEIVTPLNSASALATKEPETRAYEWEKVTLSPGRLRENRYQWGWTPGHSNWTRLDCWTGKKEIDPCGGLSTVVIEGVEFPFVSLLDWNHIQNAAKIVDVELSLECPAKYPGLGEESDGIPSSEKAKQCTAVAIHDDDDEIGTSGLTPVVRHFVCTNREEKKMLDRLGLHPHNQVVEMMKRSLPSYQTENEIGVGCYNLLSRAAYKIDARRHDLVSPHLVKGQRIMQAAYLLGKRPIAPCSVNRIIEATVIRKERARSYGTGRVVKVSPDDIYFKGFAKDLTSQAMRYYRPRPKVTGNGPGEGQTWDALGRIEERALYSDSTPRVFLDGRWRKLSHPEAVEWATRKAQSTLSVVSPYRSDPDGWKRLMFPEGDGDLLALVNFWALWGNGALGSWTPAYDRPSRWTRRENTFLVSQNDRGEGNFIPQAEMASWPVLLVRGGVTAPF